MKDKNVSERINLTQTVYDNGKIKSQVNYKNKNEVIYVEKTNDSDNEYYSGFILKFNPQNKESRKQVHQECRKYSTYEDAALIIGSSPSTAWNDCNKNIQKTKSLKGNKEENKEEKRVYNIFR